MMELTGEKFVRVMNKEGDEAGVLPDYVWVRTVDKAFGGAAMISDPFTNQPIDRSSSYKDWACIRFVEIGDEFKPYDKVWVRDITTGTLHPRVVVGAVPNSQRMVVTTKPDGTNRLHELRSWLMPREDEEVAEFKAEMYDLLVRVAKDLVDEGTLTPAQAESKLNEIDPKLVGMWKSAYETVSKTFEITATYTGKGILTLPEKEEKFTAALLKEAYRLELDNFDLTVKWV